MKIASLTLTSFAIFTAVLGAGCIAIPMGKETFTTEYPTDIRPTSDPPQITYEAQPTVSEGDSDRLTVAIGLKGEITIEQSQEQRHSKVSLVKSKYLSFGFFPGDGVFWTGTTNQLSRQGLPYQGDGIYSTMQLRTPPREKPHGSFAAWNMGAGEWQEFFGIFYTPFSLLFGAFGSYDSDKHVSGRFLGSEIKYPTNGVPYRSNSYSSEDVELLLKFPPADRERIGAWTYHEDEQHPHNTFRNAFGGFSIFGFCKWAQYEMQKPISTKSTPVPARVTTSSRTIRGPFSVALNLADHGLSEIVDVEPGRTIARFKLLGIANGDSVANGTVRFLPPHGGLAAIRDEDDRAILELAMGREWPVTVALPAPRLDKVAKPDEGGTARSGASPYQIASIGRTDDGKGLVVRVIVSDTSRTFDIDRAVQPEVRRMFREQFATGENAGRSESVVRKTEDGGKTLLYMVTFE